jgi:hypothetical protein
MESEVDNTIRFKLDKLKDKRTVKTLCAYYDSLSTNFWPLVNQALYGGPSFAHAPGGREHKERIVDTIEDSLALLVQHCCTVVLGAYHVGKKRASPSTLFDRLSSETDTNILFKRLWRLQTAQQQLVSSQPDKTPVEDAWEHYNSRFNPHDPVPQVTPPPLPHSSDFSDELVYAFNTQRIRKIIEKYPLTKACGADGIHIAILRALTESRLCEDLSRLYNNCVAWGITPARWNTVLACLLRKGKSSSTTKTRPVSLTVMFRRVFEIALLRSVTGHDWFETHHTQAGFKKGYSCLTHLLLAHDSSLFGHRAKAYVDLKGAYDLTRISDVIRKLQSRRAPSRFISLVSYLFSNCSMELVVNHRRSKPIHLKTGLLQGSILACSLFNIHIDDLAHRLQAASYTHQDPNLCPQSLIYADDIRLSAPSVNELQPLMDIVGQWCTENHMQPGYEKCEYIAANDDQGRLFLLGTELSRTEKYKYLGFEERLHGLDWEEVTQRYVEKARKSFNFLKSFTQYLRPIDRRILFQSRVLSQIEYGAPLLWQWIHQEDPKTASGKRRLALLDRYQELADDGLDWIMGWATKKSEKAVRALHASMANLPDIHTRFNELATTFIQHLETTSLSNPIRRILEIKSIPPPPTGLLDPWFIPRISLTYACSSTNILQEFQRTQETTTHQQHASPPPTTTKSALTDFIRKRRHNNWRKCGQRHECILAQARQGLGMDSSMTHASQAIRWTAMLWRRNIFGTRGSCPGCANEKFTRGHVAKRCPWLRSHQLLTEEDWNAWELEKLEMWTANSNYNILDSLLNRNRLEAFASICDAVSEFNSCG